MYVEVLLPAFVIGCILARSPGSDPRRDAALEDHQTGSECPDEQRVATLLEAVFMVPVGLSLPPLAEEVAAATTTLPQTVSSAQPMPGWEVMAGHVLALTGLANLGKMAPALCYRREPPRERAVGPGDRIAILTLHRRWDAKAMAAGMVREP